MAKTGDVLENPGAGERIVFRVAAAETGGAYTQFDQYLLKPRAGYSPTHIHLRTDERFEVISGTAAYTLGGLHRTAGPGEVVEVPRGTLHRNPWNRAGGELHLLRTVTPPSGAELFYETFYGLAGDGKDLDFWQAALTSHYIHSETYFFPPNVPIPIQRAALPLVAWLARLKGYRPYYPKYTQGEL
ncbi:MAG: cupin domain-containing protein [Chloroflexi bacterium]|nr:cupin domain-containing protein [Chloroflexota bacterium]